MDKPHFSHPDHKLTYRELTDQQVEAYNCKGCSEIIVGPAYICEASKFGLHKSCAELSGEIKDHPLHPDYPLTLSYEIYGQNVFICDGCRCISAGFNYSCKWCKFNLDVKCAFNHDHQQTLKLGEKIVTKNHSSHEHELNLFCLKERKISHMICCCCLKTIQDLGYCCVQCEFIIHESCLDDIPQQFESSFHPQHLLDSCPIVSPKGSKDCYVCQNKIKGISLSCKECDIFFHVACAKRVTRNLSYKCHEHNLFYMVAERKYRCYFKCFHCNSKCIKSFYRCVECNLNFHLECISLPAEVMHDCHDHPLILKDSVALNNVSGKYHCDVCEKEGNTKHHVYQCKEDCIYNVHIECVISKDINSVKILSCLEPRSKEDDVVESEEEEKRYVHDFKFAGLNGSYIYGCGFEVLNKRIADGKEEIDALTLELEAFLQERARIS